MKKYVSKKREINNIKNYFIALYWILEQLFESQYSKIELKTGYDLYDYLQKTKYRIEKLCVFLKKIFATTNSEEIKKQTKKKEKEFQTCVIKYANCEESSKNHIKFFIGSILWTHCGHLLFNIEKYNIEELKDLLLMEIYENSYEYSNIIFTEITIKYGSIVAQKELFYKKKPITQRLKKNSWKKLKNKIISIEQGLYFFSTTVYLYYMQDFSMMKKGILYNEKKCKNKLKYKIKYIFEQMYILIKKEEKKTLLKKLKKMKKISIENFINSGSYNGKAILEKDFEIFAWDITKKYCEKLIEKEERIEKQKQELEKKEIESLILYFLLKVYAKIRIEMKEECGVKIVKEKAITQRLKKNSWKKLKIK